MWEELAGKFIFYNRNKRYGFEDKQNRISWLKCICDIFRASIIFFYYTSDWKFNEVFYMNLLYKNCVKFYVDLKTVTQFYTLESWRCKTKKK